MKSNQLSDILILFPSSGREVHEGIRVRIHAQRAQPGVWYTGTLKQKDFSRFESNLVQGLGLGFAIGLGLNARILLS